MEDISTNTHTVLKDSRGRITLIIADTLSGVDIGETIPEGTLGWDKNSGSLSRFASGSWVTTLTQSTITGNLTGNVTGNVTGDVAGNVVGNVTGTLTGDVFGDRIKSVGGDLLTENGSSVPANGTAGYAHGCMFQLSSNTSGVGQWVNIGTSTSCKFVPFGPQSQYGFKMAGIFTTIGGDANESYIIPEARADDLSFVSYAVSDDTDTIAENIPTDGNLTFTASADPLTAHAIHFALVQSGVESTYGIVAAGKHIATGVANPQVITVTGALAGDIALVQFGAVNTGPRTIAKAVVTANTLTVTLSGAPTVGDGINYVILRRRGGFKESHYIAYAGRITTVGGDATEVITVTGNEAINVPIVVYATSDDTDTITTVTSNADNITVVCSADPLTDHSFHYMSLKAY